MVEKKDKSVEKKSSFHPRNKHQGEYDFDLLVAGYPELAPFLQPNKFNTTSIDFTNPLAVLNLNKALLKQYYNLAYWDRPSGYLCPPIPGRADYIHHIADLLSPNGPKALAGRQIKGLDIGIGANCIYPIIGNMEYGWSFVGSDIDPKAIESSGKIVNQNSSLVKSVELRLQTSSSNIFSDIIKKGEQFDFTMCNPPFHSSAEEARLASVRKVKNLTGKKNAKPVLNFGGQSNELWCAGGEEGFIGKMIFQSVAYAKQCLWFTTLVSKESLLRKVGHQLHLAQASRVRMIEMSTGNKNSRIMAWSFMDEEEEHGWGTSKGKR